MSLWRKLMKQHKSHQYDATNIFQEISAIFDLNWFRTFSAEACIGSLEDQATFAADMSRCWRAAAAQVADAKVKRWHEDYPNWFPPHKKLKFWVWNVKCAAGVPGCGGAKPTLFPNRCSRLGTNGTLVSPGAMMFVCNQSNQSISRCMMSMWETLAGKFQVGRSRGSHSRSPIGLEENLSENGAKVLPSRWLCWKTCKFLHFPRTVISNLTYTVNDLRHVLYLSPMAYMKCIEMHTFLVASRWCFSFLKVSSSRLQMLVLFLHGWCIFWFFWMFGHVLNCASR